MATITIWRGFRSFVSQSDYENVIFNGRELGSVRFESDVDIQYRIYETEEGEVLVHYVERNGYDCTAEIYEYESLEAAKADYAFILRRAGVIK